MQAGGAVTENGQKSQSLEQEVPNAATASERTGALVPVDASPPVVLPLSEVNQSLFSLSTFGLLRLCLCPLGSTWERTTWTPQHDCRLVKRDSHNRSLTPHWDTYHTRTSIWNLVDSQRVSLWASPHLLTPHTDEYWSLRVGGGS
jgi:hypothetical protein